MGSLALLQSLKESILGQASVKAIYGDQSRHTEKRSFQLQRLCTVMVREQAREAWAKRIHAAKAAVAAECEQFL